VGERHPSRGGEVGRGISGIPDALPIAVDGVVRCKTGSRHGLQEWRAVPAAVGSFSLSRPAGIPHVHSGRDFLEDRENFSPSRPASIPHVNSGPDFLEGRGLLGVPLCCLDGLPAPLVGKKVPDTPEATALKEAPLAATRLVVMQKNPHRLGVGT
jgi:hypothetical protein